MGPSKGSGPSGHHRGVRAAQARFPLGEVLGLRYCERLGRKVCVPGFALLLTKKYVSETLLVLSFAPGKASGPKLDPRHLQASFMDR